MCVLLRVSNGNCVVLAGWILHGPCAESFYWLNCEKCVEDPTQSAKKSNTVFLEASLWAYVRSLSANENEKCLLFMTGRAWDECVYECVCADCLPKHSWPVRFFWI